MWVKVHFSACAVYWAVAHGAHSLSLSLSYHLPLSMYVYIYIYVDFGFCYCALRVVRVFLIWMEDYSIMIGWGDFIRTRRVIRESS